MPRRLRAPRFPFSTLAFWGLMVAAVASCTQVADEDALERERLRALATQLDLPPVPPMEALSIVSQYPDDSYSVSGLLQRRAELFDQPVVLTAIVRELYACDPETAEPSAPGRTGCLRPHLWVTDTLRSQTRMLVVGEPSAEVEALQVGARYQFTGHYVRQTAGHLSAEEGLVVVQHIEALRPGEPHGPR